MANALVSLVSVWDGPMIMLMKPLVLLKSSKLCYKNIRVMEARVDQKSWFYNVKQYLDKREYSTDASEKDKTVIRKLAAKFTYH